MVVVIRDEERREMPVAFTENHNSNSAGISAKRALFILGGK